MMCHMVVLESLDLLGRLWDEIDTLLIEAVLLFTVLLSFLNP